MGAKRIKREKSNLITQEQVLSLTERAKAWGEEHQTQLVSGAVVLLVLLAAVWGFTSYANAKEKRAQKDYAIVAQDWPQQEPGDPKEWEGLAPKLEKFIEEHEGTRSAVNAELDLARTYFQMQKLDDALKWNTKALKDAPDDTTVRALAHYQLAEINEALGNVEGAIAQWTAFKKEGTQNSSREADWHLALLYSKKGDYSKAVEQYELAMKASGNYPAGPMLQEELDAAKIKAGVPVGNPGPSGPKPEGRG